MPTRMFSPAVYNLPLLHDKYIVARCLGHVAADVKLDSFVEPGFIRLQAHQDVIQVIAALDL